MKPVYAEEYDLGTADGYAAAQRDPGIPDEMVQAIEQEPQPLADINTEFAAELLAPMAGAVFVTIVVVELVKGLGLRNLLAGWDRPRRQTAYRWATAITAGICAFTFGFDRAVLNATGVRLSVLEVAIYGSASISVTAHVLYQWRLIQAAKIRVYRFLQVEERDLHTRSEAVETFDPPFDPPFDPDDAADK
jgi:hypothetical protein